MSTMEWLLAPLVLLVTVAVVRYVVQRMEMEGGEAAEFALELLG